MAEHTSSPEQSEPGQAEAPPTEAAWHWDENHAKLLGPKETIEVPWDTKRDLEKIASQLGETAGYFLDDFAMRLPAELPWDEHDHATFTIDFGFPVGEEKVTSLSEMKQATIINNGQERLLDDPELLQGVHRANISGDRVEKSRLVNLAYLRGHHNKLRLAIRKGSIVPVYQAPYQPTTELFVVITREEERDKRIHIKLAMVAPGRQMPRLPSDPRFHAREEIEGVSHVMSVHRIREKLANNEPVSQIEQQLVIEQIECQAEWWNGGFLEPESAEEHTMEFERPALVVVIGPAGYTTDWLQRKAPEAAVSIPWADTEAKHESLVQIAAKLTTGTPVVVECPPRHRRTLAKLAARHDAPAHVMLLAVDQRDWAAAAPDLPKRSVTTGAKAYARARQQLFLEGSYSAEGFTSLKVTTPEQAERIDRVAFRT